MGKKYRYILNMGLAFDEDRAMNKLGEMAKEGWILEEMSLFRYRLMKGQPKELIYSMDYKQLGENTDEYFQMFEGSGWKHMCSYGPYHFFSASPNTVPIYTEKENYLSKYESSKQGYKKIAIANILPLVIIIILQFLLRDIIDGTIVENILFMLGGISAALAAPSIMVIIAYYIKEKRIKANKTKIGQ